MVTLTGVGGCGKTRLAIEVAQQEAPSRPQGVWFVDLSTIADAEGFGLLDFDVTGTPFEKWDDATWMRLGIVSQNWMLSQFMHGEQGALLCTA